MDSVFNADGQTLLLGKATADRVNRYFSEISEILIKMVIHSIQTQS